MKPTKATFLALCLTLALATQAQHPNRLSRVKIQVPASQAERLQLIALLELDHFVEQGGFIEAEINQDELNLLKQSRYNHEVVIDDLITHLEKTNRAYYEGRRNGTINMDGTYVNSSGRVAYEQPNSTVASIIAVPSAFVVQPTFGGYYSYAQMVTAIENLYNTYSPSNLVDTFHIGTSVDGTTIYAVKISDNASTDESDEPEAFFQGVQHAREAIGGSSMIFLMQYLCEQYQPAANNTAIRNLVDNREVYIVVCMNPDGWEWNRNNGGAGAGWRKNRKSNGGGDWGVDLNRNWNTDWANCTGAVGAASCGSNDPGSDVYWGPSAFSEPETQAVRNFIRSKHIVVANDQHSVGPYFSLPFGRPALHTSDPMTAMELNWYKAIPALMGKYNGMRAGNSVQALGYEVAGGVKDWMFRGDLGTGVNGGLKSTIMGMTGEGGYGTTGSSTFWPPSTAIITLCRGMVYQDIQMIYSAGSYVDIQDNSEIVVPNGATSGNFSFKVRRLGVDNQPVTVTLVPITNVATVGAPVIVTTTDLANYYDTYTGNISYTLHGGMTAGQQIRFAWKVETTGYSYSDTITKFYNIIPLLSDDMEGNINTNWSNINEGTVASGFGYNYSGGNWLFTSGGLNGSDALSESADGTDYTAQSIRILQYNSTFNLSSATAAYLTFHTKHFAENFHDKLQVQISTDGTTWTAISGKRTIKEPGINEGTSINGQAALTGIENEWVKEEFNLVSYLSYPSVRLRFVFTSDQTSSFHTAQDEGFFIDDLKVISTNTPLLTLGANFISFTGKLLSDNTVELKWDAVTDQKHKYFDVEKSADQTNFVPIGRIEGSSLFRLIDNNPFVGNNFYRIKEVDVDGQASFSNIVNVPFNPKVQLLQLYPNPVKDDLTVRMKLNGPDRITIQVLDLNGRVLKAVEGNADNSIRDFQVNVSQLPSDVYILKIINSLSEIISVQKFVKQ